MVINDKRKEMISRRISSQDMKGKTLTNILKQCILIFAFCPGSVSGHTPISQLLAGLHREMVRAETFQEN